MGKETVTADETNRPVNHLYNLRFEKNFANESFSPAFNYGLN